MKPSYDIHIHTNLSSCAVSDATVEKYLECAVKDGLKTVGFSNHLWDSAVPGASQWYQPQNVSHVLGLKQELASHSEREDIRILFGCETEFTHEGKLCLAEENMDLFDYILVPHSHTHMRVVMPQEYAEDHRVHANYLMDSFMKVVTHPLAKRFTAVAHPFVPGTRFAFYNTVQALIPDSYLAEAFDAAKENGVAIELNGSCLIFMPEDEIPNCEYVRIFSLAKSRGCKFTYGSDSHDWRTDRRLDVIERFLSQCHIDESDFLTI